VTVAAGFEPMPGSSFELLEAAVEGSAPDSESLRVAAPTPGAAAEPSLAEESIALAED
jgi:hypothetical protein